MSRRMNVEFGFLVLREWLPVLETMSAKDFKTLVLGMMYKQFENRPMPTFRSAATNNIVRLIEPTIDRRLVGAAWAKKGQEVQRTPTGGPAGIPVHLAEQSGAEQSKAEHILAEQRGAEQSEPPCPASATAGAGSADAVPSGALRALTKEEAEGVADEEIPAAYVERRRARAMEHAQRYGQDVHAVLLAWWKQDKAAFVSAQRQTAEHARDAYWADFFRAAQACTDS